VAVATVDRFQVGRGGRLCRSAPKLWFNHKEIGRVKTMLERITYGPNILGGKPIIKGTRISVQFTLELLGAGMSIDEILAEYPHLQCTKIGS